LDKVLTEE